MASHRASDYGPDEAELLRRARGHLHRQDPQGCEAVDLPMQQPTTFDLNINMSIAKRLGISVSPICNRARRQGDRIRAARGDMPTAAPHARCRE